MPLYRYRARDARGHRRKGEVLAPSGREARRILREAGLRPLALAAGGEARLSDAEFARLARQLATLLKAGFDLERALSSLARSDEGRLRPLLFGLVEEIRAGQSLSKALRRARMTGEDVVLMVEAGEAAGSLPRVLAGLADLYDRRSALASRLAAALVYPGIVMALSVGVVLFLLGYVLPRMEVLFDDPSALPIPTRIVLTVATVTRYGGVPAGAAALLGLVWHRRRRNDPGHRLRLERLRARLPFLGRIETRAATARFLRTLGTLLGGGVGLVEALPVAGAASGSVRLARAAHGAGRRVAEGESLARAMSAEAPFLPPVVVEAISLGEASGALPEVIGRLSDAWGEEVAREAETAANAVVPLLLVAIGAVVAVVALAVLLPVFRFEQGVL